MPRSAAGVYTLPAGNPVVTNTLITSTWANNTMTDMGSEMTNSLDRSGRGGMLAALKGVDGTVGAPLFSFTSEPTSGFYRTGAGAIGVAILGSLVGSFTATGWADATGKYVLKAGDTMTGALVIAPAAGNATSDIKAVAASSASLRIAGNGLVPGTTSLDLLQDSTGGYLYQRSNASLFIGTNNTTRMTIIGSGLVGIGRTPSIAPLEIAATDDARLVLDGTGSNASSGSNVLFYRTSTFLGAFGISANRLGDSSTDIIAQAVNNLRFNTGAATGTEAMRITSAQKIGIGGAPTGKVTIVTAAGTPSGTAWGNDWFCVGNGTTSATGAGVGIGYDTVADAGMINCIAPTTAWKKLIISSGGLDLLTSNGVLAFRISTTGSIYGASLHNNAGGAGSGSATTQFIASGTYTPTLTNTTNIDSSTAAVCQWIRVGNVVHVAGTLQLDPTAASAATVLGISLPLASNLASFTDLGGVASGVGAGVNVGARIIGDSVNDRASLTFTNDTNTANTNWSFVFSYTVL